MNFRLTIETHKMSQLLVAAVVAFCNAATIRSAAAQVLPPCPAPLSIAEYFDDPVPNTVLVDGGGSAFYRTVIKGLGRTPACANMSYVRPFVAGSPVPTTSERAITSSVFPSVLNRTDSFIDVTFDIVGAGVPAPFTAGFQPCFPASATGTCENAASSPIMAIREADDDGEFSGPWSVIHSWKDSPVQFDRLGECISTAPVGSSQSPSSGPPCSYRVTFLRNPNAANDFVLQKPTQVIVHATWSGGITLSSDGTGTNYAGTSHTIFSLLLTPTAEEPTIESINPEVLALVDSLEALASQLKKSFPKSKKQQQRFIATELRSKSSALVALIADNPEKIQTTGSAVDIAKLARSVRSAVLTFVKRRAESFSSDKRKVKRALRTVRDGLST